MATIEPRQILDRRGIDQIDFARKQRRDTCGGRGDRQVFDAVEIVLLLVPPLVVDSQNRLAVWHPAFELEGTGSVAVMGRITLNLGGEVGRFLGLVVFQPQRIEHEDVGHVVQEQRSGGRYLEIDRVIVNLLAIDIKRNIAPQRRGGSETRFIDAMTSSAVKSAPL